MYDAGNFAIPMSESKAHSTKGGMCLTDYLTYNSLRPTSDHLNAGAGDYLRQFWTCPGCHVKMPMTVSERVRHQAVCAVSQVGHVTRWFAASVRFFRDSARCRCKVARASVYAGGVLDVKQAIHQKFL